PVQAVDPDGDDLVYVLNQAPMGVHVDAEGIVEWTPGITDLGSHQIEIQVSDGRGGVATQTFTITVVESAANEPPVITSLPPATAHVGEMVVYQVVAVDPEGDQITFLLTEAPTGATVSSSGRIQWLPDASHTGEQDFTIEVSDGHGGSASQSFTVTVLGDGPDITPPLIFLNDVSVGVGEVA